MSNLPFVEKYRPQTFDELVGVDVDKIEELIKDVSSMPNLLFLGSPGTGKTSTAKLILKILHPIDVLRLNGSDTTGVDTIRERVYNYMISRSTIPNKPKIVWIEEFDYLSSNAYAALRSMMEEYSSNSRFICTANYTNNIPDPIKSRFSVINYSKPTSEEIESVVRRVCEYEDITIDENALKILVDNSDGDVRKALNTLQFFSKNETKTISMFDVIKDESLSNRVYGLLMSKDWNTLRYELPSKRPDYKRLITELDETFFNSTEISVQDKRAIVVILAQAQFELNFSFDHNITFSAMASKIISVLEK